MQIKYTAIAYLSVLLTLNSLLLSSVKAQASYVSFLDWCQAQEKLNSEAKHTIKAVLEELGSADSTRASKRLNVITRLNLASRQISDVRPLGSLTNLTQLIIFNNQISDVTALSSLTNLKVLQLGYNQVSDISPLASLTNLTLLGLTLTHT